MNRCSNSPKGVMMAVFGMSAAAMGTWWYPLTRSLAEDGAAVQAIVQVLHVWEGVPVGRGDCVEAAVVAAGPPGSVFFGDHVQGRCPCGIGSPNDTCFFEFLELRLGDF